MFHSYTALFLKLPIAIYFLHCQKRHYFYPHIKQAHFKFQNNDTTEEHYCQRI